MPVDLFSLDCECGCAAKVSADWLAAILREVDLPTRPEILVGAETLDDAGIYQISADQCLVQTIDYFPPPARDPYTYGQIAAANSLSDVYAMGGEPLMALAVVCFPAQTLGTEVLQEITKGAVDKLRDAGAVLLGGHSIIDERPKYGLAVTGVVNPADIMDNAHARPGDALILTKPLGTGITIMAAKAGMASREQEEQANRSMSALNADASRIARECGATSCTDVTGFGLLGHALQMAGASGVLMEFSVDALPRLDGVLDYAAMGLLSAATYSNRTYAERHVAFDPDITQAEEDLLFDPQTSGGLLVSCPQGQAEEAIRRGRERLSTPCAVIGNVTETEGETRIRIRRGR